VVAMRMMQASAHDVIDVIAMGHRFVPAGRAMLVGAARLRRALCVDRNDVLVDMILVHVMEMPVMQIIDVAVTVRQAAGRARRRKFPGRVLRGRPGKGRGWMVGFMADIVMIRGRS
jgi:hypothetical protein